MIINPFLDHMTLMQARMIDFNSVKINLLFASFFLQFRSNCPEVFCKKGVQACNFIKKETLAQVFSCEFCEIFKNIYFIEHLRWLLLTVNRFHARVQSSTCTNYGKYLCESIMAVLTPKSGIRISWIISNIQINF